MSKIWNLGDTVRLKSGGPQMTIEKAQYNDVECVWFIREDPKTPCRGVFPSEILESSSIDNWGR